jgi:hypothetical protein
MKVIISATEFENLFKQAKPFLAMAKKNNAGMAIQIDIGDGTKPDSKLIFDSEFVTQPTPTDKAAGGKYGFRCVIPCRVVG